jgi:hypothetical protein
LHRIIREETVRFSPIRLVAPSSNAASQIYVHVRAFAVGPSIPLLIPADASEHTALFCLVCRDKVELPRNEYIGGQVKNVGAYS